MVDIKIEKPRVPNFVKTDKGMFSLADLSDEEFDHYINITRLALISNRSRQHNEKSRT